MRGDQELLVAGAVDGGGASVDVPELVPSETFPWKLTPIYVTSRWVAFARVRRARVERVVEGGGSTPIVNPSNPCSFGRNRERT